MTHFKSLLITTACIAFLACNKEKDFRNDLTGNYKVKKDYHWFSMGQQSSYNYSSDTTISIDKGSEDSTFIVEPSDGNIRIGYGYISSSAKYQLYLQHDSIFFYRTTGGKGGGTSLTYKGYKIQ